MDDERRLPALTGLRGFAALWVLVFHAWALAGGIAPTFDSPWSFVAAGGWLGVDVFFVLSGFLLCRGLLGSSGDGKGTAPMPAVDWRAFALMRAMRLLPAYYVQLVVLALLGLGSSTLLAWRPDHAGDVLAHGLLWLNAWPWVPAHLGPWWSLSVEALFYASLPLLLPAFRSGRGVLLLLMAAALLAVAWRWGLQAVAAGIEQRIGWTDHAPGRWIQFISGGALAWMWSRRDGAASSVRGRGDAVVLGAVLALLALPWIAGARPFNGIVDGQWWTWAWPLFTVVPVVGLLWALLAEPRSLVARMLSGAVPAWVGRVSFSLYLWHYPVQWTLRDALGGYVPPAWGLAGFTIASLVLSLVVAGLSWWAVERPAMNAARRWRARLAAPERSAS